MRKLRHGLVAAMAALAAVVVVPAQPAFADPSPTCKLHAAIALDGVNPIASGARAFDCIDAATLTLRIRQDISFSPDKTLAEVKGSGRDIFLDLRWTCTKAGGGIIVFAESISSLGGSVQSSRIGVPGCAT